VLRQELTVTLPRGAYRALGQIADRYERSAEQQASYLLRRVLESMARETGSAPDNQLTDMPSVPGAGSAVEAVS
jgi:hypothetical protein